MNQSSSDDWCIQPPPCCRRVSSPPPTTTCGTNAPMMVEDDPGLVHKTPKKQKTSALNSSSLTQYSASMYLPATKALEYEMGSAEDKLMVDSSSPGLVVPMFHKTAINRSRLADENSLIQAASLLSLNASKRADNDDAARYNLNNDISQAVLLDLVVVGLDEDFPLIEWNNEEADKSTNTLSQSSFIPVLSPSFGHDEHNSHHRLLRSKSFGSKLVALETLQAPISY
jgi:hypothetical protein